MSQPALVEGGQPAFGVSDILTSFFFSPSKPGLTWGVGPAISLPSTSIPTLGTEKWSAGPTVVVLKQSGKLTFGTLWNQVWSFSGNTDRADVNQMFLQPFFAYQATRTVTVTVQSETTANWKSTRTGGRSRSMSSLQAVVVRRVPRELPVRRRRVCGASGAGPSWKVRGAIVVLMPRRR